MGWGGLGVKKASEDDAAQRQGGTADLGGGASCERDGGCSKGPWPEAVLKQAGTERARGSGWQERLGRWEGLGLMS